MRMDFRGQDETACGVVPDGACARYHAQHIFRMREWRHSLNLGGTADSLEFVPKQSKDGFVRGFLFAPHRHFHHKGEPS